MCITSPSTPVLVKNPRVIHNLSTIYPQKTLDSQPQICYYSHHAATSWAAPSCVAPHSTLTEWGLSTLPIQRRVCGPPIAARSASARSAALGAERVSAERRSGLASAVPTTASELARRLLAAAVGFARTMPRSASGLARGLLGRAVGLAISVPGRGVGLAWRLLGPARIMPRQGGGGAGQKPWNRLAQGVRSSYPNLDPAKTH